MLKWLKQKNNSVKKLLPRPGGRPASPGEDPAPPGGGPGGAGGGKKVLGGGGGGGVEDGVAL